MKAILSAAILLCATGALAEDEKSYRSLMDDARAAFAEEDWRAAQEALDGAQIFRPYSLYLTRNRILVRVLQDDFDGALAIVSKIANRGLSVTLAGHPAFEALMANPEYAPLGEQMAANVEPAGDSEIALEIPDDGLLPESLVTGADGAMFIGSVRTGRIVNETVETFVTAPGGVYALDIADNVLWAAANSAPPYENAPNTPAAGLYAYSLKDGAVLHEAMAPDGALLGDVEIVPAGIIASDSAIPRLFILHNGSGALQVLAEDTRFVNLQGVAYDVRRKKLYVADYLAGLFAVDIDTGAVNAVANKADAHLGGIDGLYVHRRDLIAIQNGTTPQRIVRLKLDRKGKAVKRLDVLVQNHPSWAEPTNGEVAGDTLSYIATSNWPAYDGDGNERDGATRAPVRVMMVDLD